MPVAGWRPHLPGELVHKTTACYGIAPCGATERLGARFSTRLPKVTCEACRARVRELRAAAKERMARELAG